MFERNAGCAIDASLLKCLEHAGRKREPVESVMGRGGCRVPFFGDVHHSCPLNQRALANWLTQSGANLLFRAAGPALVEAWILDLNGEVVAGTVTSGCGAGGTSCPPVPAVFTGRTHVVENSELRVLC